MVSDRVGPRAKINFHTTHGYRIHGNRSDLEISLLFPQKNSEIKFGSTDSHFLFVSGLYAHKLHAPCSHAPCSRSHDSVVGNKLETMLYEATFPALQVTSIIVQMSSLI